MNLRKWTVFGLLAAALFFWQAGCHLLNRFPQEQAVSMKLEKGLPAASYEEMIRTESQAGLAVPFVLWTQLEAQSIFSFSGREAQTAVIPACGDIQLLFSFPLALEDQTGVLIDRNTAHTLFGAADGMGAEIIYHEKRYKIRGLLDCPLPTAVFQADSLQEITLDHVTLANGKQIQPFIMRHHLNPIHTTKNMIWKQLASFICFLPPAFGTLWIGSILLKAVWKARKKPVPETIASLGLLFFVFLCFFALLNFLPAQWIPSRWSNLSFWPQAFSVWKRDTLEWISSPKYRPDLTAMLPGKVPFYCGIFSCISLLTAGQLFSFKK